MNKAALDMMMAEGRTPICSHNPYAKEFMGTLFRMEVDYLWAVYRVVFKLDATASVWIGTVSYTLWLVAKGSGSICLPIDHLDHL